LASQLLEAAKTVARKNPKSEVIFKAHPRDSIELLVEILSNASPPSNLRLATLDESSLNLCATSETVVGVFSATLFEALGLGAKVGILKLPGWEHARRLLTGGYAKAFASAEELSSRLDELPTQFDPHHFYAPKANLSKEIEALQERNA
jgi:hypothetical protein